MKSLAFADQGQSERNVVALRVTAVAPDTGELDRPWISDAGWLAQKGATIGSIEMTIGLLRSDGGQVHVRSLTAAVLTALNPKTEGVACPHGEQAMLRSFADLLAQLSSPLVITCGGRRQDLPLLRYRCLAQLVPLEVLHLSVGNRWKYFDRFDSSWHLDIADLLAGYGASSELELDDLSHLCAWGLRKFNINGPQPTANESNAIIALFLRFLFLTSRMDKPAYEIAIAELSEVASGKSCSSSLLETGVRRSSQIFDPDAWLR